MGKVSGYGCRVWWRSWECLQRGWDEMRKENKRKKKESERGLQGEKVLKEGGKNGLGQ